MIFKNKANKKLSKIFYKDAKKNRKILNEYHKAGISTHTENGCSFTVDDEFRKKIKKLSEK